MTEQGMSAGEEAEILSKIRGLSKSEYSSLMLTVVKYKLEGGDFEAMLTEWRAGCERAKPAPQRKRAARV